MRRKAWKSGHRVREDALVLVCSRGHRVKLNPHTTVPPCATGTRGNRCGSTRYQRED